MEERNAINSIADLGDLPVWLDHDSDGEPSTYQGLFWEVEPLGEYLFFLAGDFPKNDGGLLRFASAKTSLRFEVTHERDALGVTLHDARLEQSRAAEAGIAISYLAGMTLGEVASPFPRSTNTSDDRCGYIDLDCGKNLATGFGRVRVMKPPASDEILVELLFQRIIRSENPEMPHALLSIVCRSMEITLEFDALLHRFRELVERYRNFPYRHLVGATRI